jgi:hypothetical protein
MYSREKIIQETLDRWKDEYKTKQQDYYDEQYMNYPNSPDDFQTSKKCKEEMMFFMTLLNTYADIVGMLKIQ